MVLLVLVGDDEPLGEASVGQDGDDDRLVGKGALEALVQQVGVGASVEARGGEHGRLELRDWETHEQGSEVVVRDTYTQQWHAVGRWPSCIM